MATLFHQNQAVDAATNLVRTGTAARVQMVPEKPHFLLRGPGFAVRIERTGSGLAVAEQT